MPNLDLKPEVQRSLELGTNLSFFKDRVSLDFTYYKTNTFNQILTIPGVAETGYSSRRINAGNIQNQGIEITLNATPVKRKDFKWDVSVNFTENRGKVISFYPGITDYTMMGGYDGVEVHAYEGGDFGVMIPSWGYASFDYDAKTGFPIIKTAGRLTSTDPNTKYDFANYTWSAPNDDDWGYNPNLKNMKLGKVEPSFLAGFNSSLHWKQFSLFAQIDSRFGGVAYSEAYNYGMGRGNPINSLKYRDQEHGGVERINSYSGGKVYDGVIPDAVFAKGEKSPVSGADISGMTFRDAYSKGLVEPWRAAGYYIDTYGWGRKVQNGSVTDVSWVMLREVSVGYTFPKSMISGAHLKGARINFTARNIGYLYNGLSGGQNPESLQSNNPFMPMMTGGVPFSRSYAISLNISL